MNAFGFMPIWALLILFFTKKENESIDKKSYQVSFLGACITFLPIFLLASFGAPYSDTTAYITNYLRIDYDYFNLSDLWNNSGREKGFTLFNYFIYNLSNGSVATFRIAVGLIHILPVIYIFRKYSCNYMLSAFLFITSTTYIAWMMNGLRQFMAVTIIFAATPLLIKKRFGLLIAIILLASTFHFSCLIMLPIIFIAHGKAFNKWNMLFIFMAIVATWIFSLSFEVYEQLMETTGYGDSTKELRATGDDGASFLRVIIAAVPVVLAYLNKDKIRESNDVLLNICVNLAIINMGIYMVATVTSGIMIGRLPIYVSLYNYILLPLLIKKFYTENLAKQITFAMVCCYLIYYLFEAKGLL